MQPIVVTSGALGIDSINYAPPKARKPQKFVSYGFDASRDKLILQSQTRIMEVSIKENSLKYSPSISGGAYFHHLNHPKVVKIDLPEDLKEAIKNFK